MFRMKKDQGIMVLTKHVIFVATMLALQVFRNAIAFQVPHGPRISISRRKFIATSFLLPTAFTSKDFSRANAIPLFDKKDRRQLELCLVSILRLQYWSMTVAYILENSQTEDERKSRYLEARLGAKAMVAEKQKVGGGASYRVFTLSSLQIKDCLDDLKFYAKNKQMDQYKEDLIESLASIVEFDGLETTQDPSPRSSLTLGQYNSQKAVFVQRMLAERVTPLTKNIVGLFGPETVKQCEMYVEQYYSSELPPKPEKSSDQSAEEII